MLTITEKNFKEEVLDSTVPVLVDFWASWCGPCKMIAPTLELLAKDVEGKAKVGKVNVDEEGALAEKFSVMSIPTIIVFKNGKVIDKAVGVKSLEELKALLHI